VVERDQETWGKVQTGGLPHASQRVNTHHRSEWKAVFDTGQRLVSLHHSVHSEFINEKAIQVLAAIVVMLLDRQ